MSAAETDGAAGGPETATGPRPARVFVALRVAAEIARELARHGQGLEKFLIRVAAIDDIHLTLVPPWNEVSIPDAVAKLRGVANRSRPFTLVFRHIGYGPQPKRPRFLWVECVAGKEVAELRTALLQVFGQTDERPFLPHVTLARLRDKGRIIARGLPVNHDIALEQWVETVELMQSPPPGDRGYKVLASLPLGGDRAAISAA